MAGGSRSEQSRFAVVGLLFLFAVVFVSSPVDPPCSFGGIFAIASDDGRCSLDHYASVKTCNQPVLEKRPPRRIREAVCATRTIRTELCDKYTAAGKGAASSVTCTSSNSVRTKSSFPFGFIAPLLYATGPSEGAGGAELQKEASALQANERTGIITAPSTRHSRQIIDDSGSAWNPLPMSHASDFTPTRQSLLAPTPLVV
jgi:hypothetical protein